jgi:hypothetical protein
MHSRKKTPHKSCAARAQEWGIQPGSADIASTLGRIAEQADLSSELPSVRDRCAIRNRNGAFRTCSNVSFDR